MRIGSDEKLSGTVKLYFKKETIIYLTKGSVISKYVNDTAYEGM